ncbi:hypothetical protein K469DRAFT_717106 [Zopfia rhizophila CBS 207.26]|uniref:DUF7730 domain-containing protein n=1 Tax=Zopfia rhizophila CBS 207.26 TaxID=1314779 RepID=A0A6A6EP56_9PEZI|nr:hypothetical protein K469DRAFT_717106 [Zopfia rhizophila CBS 207.26]
MPTLVDGLFKRFMRPLGMKPKNNQTDLQASHHTKIFSRRMPKRGPPPQAILGNQEMYRRQAASMLMSKLPFELREMIWEYFLGGNRIHCYWKDKETLLGFICERQDQCVSFTHNQKREVNWISTVAIREEEINQEKRFMNLLRTCRAIYFEASKVMYSSNLFDFTDHWVNFKYLPWVIPLSAISSIAQVHMACYDVPLPSKNIGFTLWVRSWETLALLKGLRYLHVELTGSAEWPKVTAEEMMEYGDEFLEPVKLVKWPMIFELVLPFPEKKDGKVRRELACTIIRTEAVV